MTFSPVKNIETPSSKWAWKLTAVILSHYHHLTAGFCLTSPSMRSLHSKHVCSTRQWALYFGVNSLKYIFVFLSVQLPSQFKVYFWWRKEPYNWNNFKDTWLVLELWSNGSLLLGSLRMEISFCSVRYPAGSGACQIRSDMSWPKPI